MVHFIHQQYEILVGTMTSNLYQTERAWRRKEQSYDRLVHTLFFDGDWPRGKYIASPTIWGLCPKFLEDKTFLVPYRRRGGRMVNVVIAHELLHFIFDYHFRRWYPQYRQDQYELLSWHISELFNTVVQHTKPWIRVFGIGSTLYPEHRSMFRSLLSAYADHPHWKAKELTDEIVCRVAAWPQFRRS